MKGSCPWDAWGTVGPGLRLLPQQMLSAPFAFAVPCGSFPGSAVRGLGLGLGTSHPVSPGSYAGPPAMAPMVRGCCPG